METTLKNRERLIELLQLAVDAGRGIVRMEGRSLPAEVQPFALPGQDSDHPIPVIVTVTETGCRVQGLFREPVWVPVSYGPHGQVLGGPNEVRRLEDILRQRDAFREAVAAGQPVPDRTFEALRAAEQSVERAVITRIVDEQIRKTGVR